MTGALSPTHWLIIAVVLVLLLGAKRLPDTARGLGKAMRIIKAETAALSEGDRAAPDTDSRTTDEQVPARAPEVAPSPGRTAPSVTVPATNTSETAA